MKSRETDMKHMKSLVLLLVPILLFSGCKKSIEESDIVGKIYTYEKDGFGGSFTIHIKDDGTFVYNEGLLSSYIGIGKWTLDEDILLLSDDGSSGICPRKLF